MKFSISFVKTADITDKTVITLAAEGGAPAGSEALGGIDSLYRKAAATAGFKAKPATALDLVSPAGSEAARIIVLGLGKADGLVANAYLKAGGKAASHAPKTGALVVYAEAGGVPALTGHIAEFALGMMLGGYNFDRFKTIDRDEFVAVQKKMSALQKKYTALQKEHRALQEKTKLARTKSEMQKAQNGEWS